MSVWRLIYRGLATDPQRTALSVVAVGAAIVLVLVLEGFQAGLWDQVRSYRAEWPVQLVVTPPGTSTLGFSRVAIPSETVETIRRTPGVEKAHPLVGAPLILVLGDQRAPITVIGYDTVGGPPRLSAGRPVSSPGEAVMADALAKRFGLGVGNLVPLLGRDFRIAGLASGASSMLGSYVFVGVHDAYAALSVAGDTGEHAGSPNILLVEVEPGVQTSVVRQTLQKSLPGFTVLTPAELADNDVETAKGILGSVMRVFVAAAYVAGVLIIGMTLYAAVLERTRDYGIMKALGTRNTRLYRYVLGHALFFTVAGFALGVLGNLAVARLLALLEPQYYLATWDGDMLLRTGLAAAVMAAVASLLPVRQIQGVDPAMVLRQ